MDLRGNWWIGLFLFTFFLISIRTLLTFPATYQVPRPPCLLMPLQPNINIPLQNLFYLQYVLPSVPSSFISLTAIAKEELHKQTMTYHFPQGLKAVYQRTNFSTSAVCLIWQYLLWLFAVLRYSGKDYDRALWSNVRAQKQETNYTSKQSPGGHYTNSPFF